MSDRAEPRLDLDFIEEGAWARARRLRRRRLMVLGMSVGVTAVWLGYVLVAGQLGRVVDNWQAGLTMVFGSFVAGSTPQGGGAVAFPVFTKVLETPAEVARSFSLAIQTIGMGAATLAIVLVRRRIVPRVVWVGLPAAVLGFLVAFAFLTDPERPFRPALIPDAYVKVSFTLVIGAMAFIVFLGSRLRIRKVDLDLPVTNRRTYATVIALSALGGVTSALTGSGADVFVYICLAVLLGVDPKVGVPTSVIVMAGVSAVGMALVALDGQLSVQLSADGAGVVALGGEPVHDAAAAGAPVEPAFGTGPELPARQTDLFGLWLAAVPIVAWGAPLGSRFAAKVTARTLVVFVAVLAALELVTTLVFVDDLRSDPALVAFAVSGALLLVVSLWWLARHRNRLLGLPGVRVDRTLTRSDLDVAPDYREALRAEPRRSEGSEADEADR